MNAPINLPKVTITRTNLSDDTVLVMMETETGDMYAKTFESYEVDETPDARTWASGVIENLTFVTLEGAL